MSLAKKIDHVAIAVKDCDAAIATFTRNFGFPVDRLGDVPQLNIRRAFLTVGAASLEIFQPKTEQNPVAKFLAEKGEGMFLLSLEVDDLSIAADTLAQKGIKVTTQAVGDLKLAFISPKHTHGVLLQLIEHPKR